MTYEEAMQRLSEMESRYNDGFSSTDRKCLDSLYFTLFGKEITNKGCSNCYRDAFIEINIKLKKTKAMPKKSDFVLKAGAVITFFGEPKCYTNANITDEAALRFLALNPKNERLFEKVPHDWKERVGIPADETSTQSADAEKDSLIARLTAENEMLKQENESLKAAFAGPKKRKKKNDTEPAPEVAEAATEDETPAVAEPSAEADPVDGEVSGEEVADDPVIED